MHITRVNSDVVTIRQMPLVYGHTHLSILHNEVPELITCLEDALCGGNSSAVGFHIYEASNIDYIAFKYLDLQCRIGFARGKCTREITTKTAKDLLDLLTEWSINNDKRSK